MKTMPSVIRSAFQLFVLCIIALASTPAYAANPSDYMPNAAGGLRIGVAKGDKTIVLVDEPALIKSALDKGWLRARDEWNRNVVTFINNMGGQDAIEVESDLVTIENAELQVMKLDKGVSLKYVLHSNKVRLVIKNAWSLGDLSYLVNFDIELVLAVQAANPDQRLQIADGAIYLRHIRIDGENLISDLMQPLIEALLQNVQEYIEEAGSALLAAMKEIGDQFIAAVLDPIPTDAIYVDIDVDPHHGAIALCFKADAMATCSFPPIQEGAQNR